uniref:MADF domain-containing protein n=1 Tax=Cyprinus carpio carpio TaxID=630221 RepID=A0A9J7YAR1_CYPCA
FFTRKLHVFNALNTCCLRVKYTYLTCCLRVKIRVFLTLLAFHKRLVLSVSSHPELYDTSLYFYRDRNKKDLAWKSVGEEIGQPEDVCRKKWKSLRDTYLKEMEKRSGSAAGSVKKWKYSQILGFLDPFVTPRETTSNMGGVEAQVIEYNHPRDQGEGEAEVGDSETGEFSN